MSASANHFGEVPYSALTSLARRIDGNAGNGRPLSELFASFGSDAADAASLTLLSGLTRGPLAVAGDLSGVLGASRSRALTIARTELLGAYRDAQVQNYRANSDVVGEWMWSADKATACVACLDMDGQTFPLDEDLVSHPMCKCSPLPVTKGWDAILGPLGIDASDIPDTSITANYETGQDWLERQSAATQISVLGPAKYNAWQSGDIALSDLVGTRDDGAWGHTLYEKSLKQLGLNARDYLPSRARQEGLGPHGPAAVAGAREAVPPASTEPIKVALPGGGYTWIVPGDEHQFDAGGNLDLAKRDKGWQGIGAELQGLRGETTPAVTAAAASAAEAEPSVAFATDAVRTRLLERLGNPSEAQFARLMGAQAGDVVTVDKYGQVVIRNERMMAQRFVLTADDGEGVGVLIQHYNAPDGSPLPVDEQFARLLRTQVQAALAHPDAITYLRMKARPFVSDYIDLLPLGYDAPIDTHVLTESTERLLPGEFAQRFPGVATLGELVATPDGAAWWGAHGMNPDLTFDLAPGSVSIQRLNAYLRAHGMTEVK